MERDDLLTLIADLQTNSCELDDVEAKTARGGVPRDLHQDLSALANTRGGVILFGIDESKGFKAVGVTDAGRVQEAVASAATQLKPVVSVELSVHDVNGHQIVVAEIDELPPSQRPCHLRTKDEFTGSWMRVGNSTQRMGQYQVYGYISARGQPVFDEESVAGASLADLDAARLSAFAEDLRTRRPKARFLKPTLEETLGALGVVVRVDDSWRPTLAGLLAFSPYPEQFEPQLVITYMQFAGVDEHEKGPRGERFLDNQKFEGSIPEMVHDAEGHIMAHIRTATLVEGLLSKAIPEYPREAVREALMNAVVHRDYSGYVRGSQIQVKLFSDRLEIRSPGGLFSDVTLDTLEESQSTRNRRLMHIMEDLHLVDNRGSGIDKMITEMRDAHLEPPRFVDDRSYFSVTFFSHTLMMSGEGVRWLNQAAADLPLNDRQRLALLYLRHNARITNSDYRRLHRVDSRVAGRELQGLAGSGAVVMKGVRGGAHYVLALSSKVIPETMPPRNNEEKVLAYVGERGSITNAETRSLLGIMERRTAARLLRSLVTAGKLRLESRGRGSRYQLP